MVEEKVITSSAPSPSDGTTAVAADSHKRKLEDLELNNNGAESEALPDPDPVQGEENGGADESETKRPRLESNGGDVSEADGLVTQNGHQEGKKEEPEEEKEEEPEKENEEEPEEEKPEQHESADDNNGQSIEGQEPMKEPVETVTKEPISNENEKPETETSDALGQPKVEDEEPSEELPREGDVPVPAAEMQPGSDAQILSRKMDVPNDKVGVLIGKAGDTIRSLQDNSGAKIQIMRDADADPRAPTRPLELVGTLENINKAEKLIKDADAGGSPSLVARGFSAAQAASGGEQLELQVPIEKVGLIIGKGGETIRNLQTRSGARIQLIQQNPSDGNQSRERIVRVTGNKKQIDTAREMIKDVMNQTVRQSPLSGGYNQQGFRPRGPAAPQWGPRGPHHAQFSGYDYPQRGSYPSQNSQYPPPTYGNYPPPQAPRSNYGPSWEQRPPPSMHGPSPQGNYNYGQQQGPDYGHPPPYSQAPTQPYNHGYNEVKYDHHASSQQHGHMGSHSTPYAQGGTHSGYNPQDQYGKPPMYGMQPQVPHSQPYGQPRPNQPAEVPYQGPVSSAQPYGQNMPPQQTYPYPSSGPVQQSYPAYGSAPSTDGYSHTPAPTSASGYPPQGGQPVAGYNQPVPQQPAAYPQAGPAGGYGSYPTTQPGYTEQPAANTATYGYQGTADPAYGGAQGPAPTYPTAVAGQAGYAQPTQTQPTYDQSGGYANVPTPAAYGKNPSPQAAYPQYDSTQMYGAHR
ncbi:hypothetical protein BUALT_Bualt08G0147300 [Buddleja alternifolia]|uniref:K Homology domain-containing protein n=1 Tax=Buddleja alternifolia TaxID=168488 RepID=A0AAV6XD65_9LAMI|nr:hypothetical protein BUALT_Bualt08G0147300 [Buddleja alternifolia]